MVGPTPAERRARNAILRKWRDEGKPPCAICQTPIDRDEEVRVSQLWEAVVHPFSAYARVGRLAQVELDRGACPYHPTCPIPHGDYCVCPFMAVVNAIILARRYGSKVIEIPVAPGSAAERVARRAGLGQWYHNVPMIEDPRFDRLRKYGKLAPGVDESIFLEPSSWYSPPDFLTVDVDRSISEGRIVAAMQ